MCPSLIEIGSKTA